MTARENDFESRLRFIESEVEGEKALTRHLFKNASGNGDQIAAIRVEITTLQLQAERAAGNVELIKTMQVTQGTMLNILTQDVREIRTEMGQIHAQMGEMRMEMGEMRTEMGETRMRLDAMERSIDARFDEMQKNFDAKFDTVLTAIRTIAPHAPPAL
jgi:hypothetical protein